MSAWPRLGRPVASLVMLAACLVVDPAAAAGPPSGMNVTVVNTPLPVQGSVSVGGTVSISGTPNVTLSGTPVVQTQSLDERGRNPYQVHFSCVPSSEGACTATAPAPVPANKRLVIELASVRVFVAPGQDVQGVELRCSTDIDLPVFLPDQFIGSVPGLGDVYYANQRVIFYCEAGETPYVVAQFTVGSRGTAEATLTGYFVNP